MGSRSGRRRFLGLSIAALAGTTLAASCASGTTQPGATSAPTAPTVVPNPSEQHITVSVVSAAMQIAKGTDGLFHDAFVPAFFVLKAGQPTYITIVNFSQVHHTFVASGLNLSIDVQPGGRGSAGEPAPSTTTLALAEVVPGTYTWTCTIECDGHNEHWAMASRTDLVSGTYQGVFGFMGGTIAVV
jgi:plastocyanin